MTAVFHKTDRFAVVHFLYRQHRKNSQNHMSNRIKHHVIALGHYAIHFREFCRVVDLEYRL